MAELFFGEFRFDTRRLVLEGPEGPVEVRAKTLQALTHLIEHRNRFVSRAELMQEIWPDVHVTDASITQCISELRRALDDSARSPRYIETRVKYGYRFVATLYHKPTERLEPLPPPRELVEAPVAEAPSGRRRAFLVIGALVTVLAVLGAWLFAPSRSHGPILVSVSSVASGPPQETTEPVAAAIRQELARILGEADGIALASPDAGDEARLAAEIATRGTPSGRLEIVAVLRSMPGGREVWGWTWVVPAEEDPERNARRVAEQIVQAVKTSER